MRRRVIFVAIMVLMIVLICSVFYKIDSPKLDIKQLNGDLLIENKLDDKNYTFGAINYTTYNGNEKLVFNEDYYTPYCYNQDKSRILLLKYIENPKLNDYVIFEYNIKNKVLTGIINLKKRSQMNTRQSILVILDIYLVNIKSVIYGMMN